MLTIRIGINGSDIRILGAHNTSKKRGRSVIYDLYLYDPKGKRKALPFATTLHDPEDGAESLALKTIEKAIRKLNL